MSQSSCESKSSAARPPWKIASSCSCEVGSHAKNMRMVSIFGTNSTRNVRYSTRFYLFNHVFTCSSYMYIQNVSTTAWGILSHKLSIINYPGTMSASFFWSAWVRHVDESHPGFWDLCPHSPSTFLIKKNHPFTHISREYVVNILYC